MGLPSASAASTQSTVLLGTAGAFAVLAGQAVTNSGTSTISGDVGVAPGTSIGGFPPGRIISGTTHSATPVAAGAQSSLTAAYLNAAGRTPFTASAATLAGKTLTPGVYQASSSLGLTGTVTLNGHHDPTAVFIFQVGSTLTTHSSSTVALVGTAQACNVFWQVTSSATLGTTSTFVGTILALTSATVTTGVHVAGRVLARNGTVTLTDDVITAPACITPAATTPTTTTTTTPTTAPASGTGTTTSTAVATTTTPGASGSGASTLVPAVIPRGAPVTGAGGASRSGDNMFLIGVGLLALVGAGGVVVLAIRRRRLLGRGRR